MASTAASQNQPSQMLAEIIPPKVLPKSLSRFDLVTIYFALIFGSYGASQMATGGWAAIPMLVLATIGFMIPCILASWELGTLFPGEGGIYIWAHKTMGAIHGFIAGWLSWMAVFLLLPLVSTAIVAHLAFALGVEFDVTTTLFVQIASVWLITAISLARITLSQGYVRVVFFVALGTAVIAFLAGVVALGGKGPAQPVDSNVTTLDLGTYGWLFSAAVLWLLGVEIPFNMGAEFKDQKSGVRNMMIYGTIALLVGYVLGIVGILWTTPADQVNGVTAIAGAAATITPTLGTLVALGIVLAVASQGIAYQNTYSRLLFVSGVEHRLPRVFAHISPRTRNPVPALLLQAVVASVIIAIFFSQASLAAVLNIYLAGLVGVWSLSLYYLYSGIISARRHPEWYEARGDAVWMIPGGWIGVGLTALVGVIFTTASIYYVFAIPWTGDISSDQWILYMGGLMVAFILSGVIVWFLGLSRAKSVSAEADLAEYAVHDQ
jgi:glutamate:GABA antiporter